MSEINTITKAYTNLQKLEDFLYRIDYKDIDYEYAKTQFEINAPSFPAGCSAIRKGNLVGRNFDWLDTNDAIFVIHTEKTKNRYEVIGVGSNSGISRQFVDEGRYSSKFKILPFYLQDGINEYGLVAEMNVVPVPTNPNLIINPLAEQRDRICSMMLVRYVLDHFKTVDEAINYLKNYVQIYSSLTLTVNYGYELHFLLADRAKTVVVEFMDNQIKVINKHISTNFHLYNVAFNPDGSVFTNKTAIDGNLPTSQGIEPEGSGLERFNILNSSKIYNKETMKLAMNKVLFSKAYTLEVDPWMSEFVGVGITVDTPANDPAFLERYKRYQDIYEEQKGKKLGNIWITTHSCIYDIQNLTLYVSVQEGDEEHPFSLKEEHNPTVEDVEKRIREIIMKVYDACFVGEIEIIPLKTCGYTVKLGLPSIERCYSLSAELPDEKFYKYIENELRFSSLTYIKHFTLTTQSNLPASKDCAKKLPI